MVTHEAKVGGEQVGLAEEAIVESGHVAADNEGDDSRIIELVAPSGHLTAMVEESVIGGAHAETDDGAGKEAREDDKVGKGSRVIAGPDNEVDVEREGKG